MKAGNLSIAQIKALRPKAKRYTVADGGGLCLEIHPSGVKSWRVRYRLRGKAAKINVGRWPSVALNDAREQRDKIADAVRSGLSPAEARRRERERSLQGVTVREFGARYMCEIIQRSRKEPKEILRYLERDIYPSIGDKPFASVQVDDLRIIIFARRDKGRFQAALALRDLLKRFWGYAVVCGVASTNPVLLIPRKYIATANARSRSLSASEVGEFLYNLQKSTMRHTLKAGLRLILLTLTRKSELLLARWEHIDMRKGEWVIPPEHSKNKKAHVVYLSTQAREILEQLAARCAGGKPNPKHFIIPALWSRTQPISESTLNRALSRVSSEMEHFTVHDLRRTAATLLSEDEYQADVIEKALNHTIKGVRGVYNRAQYREQRRKMLQDWADKVEDFFIEQRSANRNN